MLKFRNNVDEEFRFINDNKDVACFHCFKNIGMHLHKHTCFEFIYVFRGKCKLFFEGEIIILERGDFLSEIVIYVKRNFRNVTLKELAEKFNFSVSYLSLKIRKLTGITFTENIKRLKMDKSKTYLDFSNKSIEEIAFLTGYRSADHFSRSFRQYFGFSPQKYREKGNFKCS